MYFGWTFAVDFFSGVYHPQDPQDEKVSKTQKIQQQKLTRSTQNVGAFKMQIRWLHFY